MVLSPEWVRDQTKTYNVGLGNLENEADEQTLHKT